MNQLTVSLVQMNGLVGDIRGNTDAILAAAKAINKNAKADIIVFPELTLTGYPPEDLLLRPSLTNRTLAALRVLCDARCESALVVGYAKRIEGKLYNMAGVIYDGRIIFEYAKRCLPNYQVFDEKRYFSEGTTPSIFCFKGARLGLSICEDIWDGAPLEELKQEDIDCVINLNASPFHQAKQRIREELVKTRSTEISAAILFVNWVGGQDELVFDGGSMAFDRDGVMVSRAPLLEESVLGLSMDLKSKKLNHRYQIKWNSALPPAMDLALTQRAIAAPADSRLEVIYKALVLGVKDYVTKNRFNGVVLGLSGGIDSALTLAVAVDALGADRVQAVMMPFHYTSKMSRDDAAEQAHRQQVRYHSIGIEPIYNAFISSLEEVFSGTEKDTTEENIQARSRGVLLMAISNKLGYLVLTTGNKSEMAVGYATLYGDMAGGLDVLKDVPKTTVFELARYRNRHQEIIPDRVITRPPSAELAPDQKDEDSLPSYDILDEILELYVEKDESAEAIISRGFNEIDVRKVIRLVDLNEYKRRQAPIGIRISERAFGRDRRYPITNGWHIGD